MPPVVCPFDRLIRKIDFVLSEFRTYWLCPTCKVLRVGAQPPKKTPPPGGFSNLAPKFRQRRKKSLDLVICKFQWLFKVSTTFSTSLRGKILEFDVIEANCELKMCNTMFGYEGIKRFLVARLRVVGLKNRDLRVSAS